MLRVKELCFEEDAHIIVDLHQGIQFEEFIHALHRVFVRFLSKLLQLLRELSDRNQLGIYLGKVLNVEYLGIIPSVNGILLTELHGEG